MPELYVDYDEHFAFIAGFTSGGVPYGITWEEHEIFLETADDPPDEKPHARPPESFDEPPF